MRFSVKSLFESALHQLAAPWPDTSLAAAHNGGSADAAGRPAEVAPRASLAGLPAELLGLLATHIPVPPPLPRFGPRGPQSPALGDHKALALALPGYWQTSKAYCPELFGRIVSGRVRQYIEADAVPLPEELTALLAGVQHLYLPDLIEEDDRDKRQKLGLVLAQVPRLQLLLLRGTYLGPSGLVDLNLAPHTGLTTLHLGDCALQDAGVALLAGLSLPKLQLLALPQNELTATAVLELARAELPQLSSLNLSVNDIALGQGGHALFATLAQVAAVDLRYNRFGKAAINELQHAYPQFLLARPALAAMA